MSKFQLPFVEMQVTQVCNLSCLGCSNYADLKHTGYVKWDNGKQEISRWLERMDIGDFGIMGGEPLINPELKQWIVGSGPNNVSPTPFAEILQNANVAQAIAIVDGITSAYSIFNSTTRNTNSPSNKLNHKTTFMRTVIILDPFKYASNYIIH